MTETINVIADDTQRQCCKSVQQSKTQDGAEKDCGEIDCGEWQNSSACWKQPRCASLPELYTGCARPFLAYWRKGVTICSSPLNPPSAIILAPCGSKLRRSLERTISISAVEPAQGPYTKMTWFVTVSTATRYLYLVVFCYSWNAQTGEDAKYKGSRQNKMNRNAGRRSL